MADVRDVNLVRTILDIHNESTDGEWMYELHEYGANSILTELDEVELKPANWTFSTHEVEDAREYDSYGNGYARDAYVIIKVSDGIEEAMYKIPGQYASYNGWNWELHNLAIVEKREKIVRTWEWI